MKEVTAKSYTLRTESGQWLWRRLRGGGVLADEMRAIGGEAVCRHQKRACLAKGNLGSRRCTDNPNFSDASRQRLCVDQKRTCAVSN